MILQLLRFPQKNDRIIERILHHLARDSEYGDDPGAEYGITANGLKDVFSLSLACKASFKVFYPFLRFRSIQISDLPFLLPDPSKEASVDCVDLPQSYSIDMLRSQFPEDQVEYSNSVRKSLRHLKIPLKSSWHICLPKSSDSYLNLDYPMYFYYNWSPFLDSLQYTLTIPIDRLMMMEPSCCSVESLERDLMWNQVCSGVIQVVVVGAAVDPKLSQKDFALDVECLQYIMFYLDFFPKVRHLSLPFALLHDSSSRTTIFNSTDVFLGEELVNFFSYLHKRGIDFSDPNDSSPFGGNNDGQCALILDEWAYESLSLYQLTDRQHYKEFFGDEPAANVSLPPRTEITCLFDCLQIDMSHQSYSLLFPLKETFPNIWQFSWKSWIPVCNQCNGISLLESIIPMIQSHVHLTTFDLSDIYIRESDDHFIDCVDIVKGINLMSLESTHIDGLSLFDLSTLFPNLTGLSLNGVTFQAINDSNGYPESWSKSFYTFSNLQTLHLEMGWNPWCFSTSPSLWISYWHLYHDLLARESNAPNLQKFDLVILDSPPVPYIFSWFFHLKERFMQMRVINVTVVIPLDSLNSKDYDATLVMSNLRAYHALQFLFDEWKDDFAHLEEFSLLSE